jgi:hypothetical protein
LSSPNRYPDARGAQAIAATVVACLRLNDPVSASKPQWKDDCEVFGSIKGS